MLLAGILLAIGASACALDGWSADWTLACREAHRRTAPIVLVFVHDGCPACDCMDSVITSKQSLSALASAVRVRLQYTECPDLVARFGVSGTPTLILLTPETGYCTDMFRSEGAMSQRDIIALGRIVVDSAPAARPPSAAHAIRPKATSKPRTQATSSRLEAGSTVYYSRGRRVPPASEDVR